MKQIILSISLFSFLSSVGFCQEEEKSTLRTKDALSQKAADFFAAMSRGDQDFFASFFAENVEVHVNDITVTGKQAYLARLQKITTVIFANMTFEKLHVHTNYFSPEALAFNGKTFGEVRPEPSIWTNAWATNHAVGRTTQKKSSVEMHIDFRWEGEQVVQMLAYYDPTFMNEEIAALEASQQSRGSRNGILQRIRRKHCCLRNR
jgi:hypothetical protein